MRAVGSRSREFRGENSPLAVKSDQFKLSQASKSALSIGEGGS
jgi:hypothetical protein